MCERCEILAGENNILAEQISSLQAETLQLVYQKRALKRELDAKKIASPQAKDVDRLLRLWRKTCVPKRAYKRVNIDVTGDRGDIVRAALRTKTKGTRRERWLMCRQAILGLSLRPYVINGQRKGAGPKECRYADIDHALGKTKNIELHSAFYLSASGRDFDWAYTAWHRSMDVGEQWRQVMLGIHRRERLAEMDGTAYLPPADMDSLGVVVVPAAPVDPGPRLFVVPDPVSGLSSSTSMEAA